MKLQASKSYYKVLDEKDEINQLPLSLGIGKTWLHLGMYSKILNHNKPSNADTINTTQYLQTCKDFCNEVVALLEKLQLMRLQSFNKQIDTPVN